MKLLRKVLVYKSARLAVWLFGNRHVVRQQWLSTAPIALLSRGILKLRVSNKADLITPDLVKG